MKVSLTAGCLRRGDAVYVFSLLVPRVAGIFHGLYIGSLRPEDGGSHPAWRLGQHARWWGKDTTARAARNLLEGRGTCKERATEAEIAQAEATFAFVHAPTPLRASEIERAAIYAGHQFYAAHMLMEKGPALTRPKLTPAEHDVLHGLIQEALWPGPAPTLPPLEASISE